MFNDIKTQQILAEILTKLGQIDAKLYYINKFIKDKPKQPKSGVSQQVDMLLKYNLNKGG